MLAQTPIPSEDSVMADLRAVILALTDESLSDYNDVAVKEKTRDILVKILQEHGFRGAVNGSFRQVYPEGVNLLALWGAADRPGQPKIMIGAHYDRILKNCRPHDQARTPNCNAATDNAAGVAVAISSAKLTGTSLEAPVLLALWDGEESGLTGSVYFTEHPVLDPHRLKLILNVDTVGSTLFEGSETTHLVIGTETGGRDLIQAVRDEAHGLPLNILLLSYAFGHHRCDITSFVNAGWQVPFLFFSDGDGSIYHSAADEYHRVNFDKLHAITRLVSNLIRHGDRAENAFAYQPFPIFEDRVPPRFTDVAIIRELIHRAIEFADTNGLDDRQEQRLIHAESLLDAMLREGPDAFDQARMADLVFAAKEFVSISRQRPLKP